MKLIKEAKKKIIRLFDRSFGHIIDGRKENYQAFVKLRGEKSYKHTHVLTRWARMHSRKDDDAYKLTFKVKKKYE